MENIQVLPADHPARREIVLSDPTPPPAVGNMLELIERIVTDPTINIETIERVFALQERLEERNYNRANEERIRLEQQDRERRSDAAKRAFEMALIACQAEMKIIGRDAKNEQTKSNYATYAQLDQALRPIYTKNHLSISFDEAECSLTEQEKINNQLALELTRSIRLAQQGGEKLSEKMLDRWFGVANGLKAQAKIRVLVYVTHAVEGVDSWTREYHIDAPVDGKGAKGGDVMTSTHAKGSGFTYSRRYAITNIFNIATADDDGNKADTAPIPIINAKQVARIYADIEATGSNLELFLKYFKVSCVEEMNVKQFDFAIAQLADKKRTSKVKEDSAEWST